MVRLFVNDDPDSLDLERALKEVSPERREYVLSFRSPGDQRRSLAVYLLLRGALGGTVGFRGNPRLGRHPGGKPFLIDFPDLHFSFSHCRSAAVCALADRPVGVDVESISPLDEAVAESALSQNELEAVRASDDPDLEFTRYWTRKEAFLKLTGEGVVASDFKTVLSRTGTAVFETTVDRVRRRVITVAVDF